MRVIWDVFIGVLIVFSVTAIPVRIGYYVELNRQGLGFIFDCFIDVMFLTDIVANFVTGYLDEMDLLVTDKRLIARNYVRGWFFIDLVSTVPIDLVAEAFMGSSSGAAGLSQLKLIRIIRMFRLLKLARLKKLAKIWKKVSATLDLNPAALKLVKLLFSILFLSHMLCCFWFYLGYPDCLEDEPPCEIPPRTWVTVRDLQDADLEIKYVNSMYWTIATMTAVGYGDIVAENDGEMLYTILTQLVGAAYFGFLIGNISTLLETIDVRATALKAKMNELREYMKERRLPKELQQRIKKHYTYYLSHKSVFNEVAIVYELNSTLRNAVVMEAHEDLIKKMKIFEDAEQSFIAAMVLQLRPQAQAPGEIIAREGEIGNEMWFLKKGVVELFSRKPDGSDVLLGILAEGSHFGEISLLTQSPRTASIRASTHIDMYTITKEALDDVLTYYPDARVMLMDISSKRVENMSKARSADTVTALGEPDLRSKGESVPSTTMAQTLVFDGDLQASAGGDVNKAFGRRELHREEVTWRTLQRKHRGPGICRQDLTVDRGEGRILSEASASGTTLRVMQADVSPDEGRGAGLSPEVRATGRSDREGAKASSDFVEVDQSLKELEAQWLVVPESKFRTTWDALLAICILYSVVVVPYRLGFNVNVTASIMPGWYTVDWIVDAFFWMDILVNFRTCYVVKESSALMVDPAMISRNYLTGWFLLDFLSTFPFDQVTSSDSLRIFKLFRILRLFRLLKLLRLSNFLMYVEDALPVNPAVFSLFKLFWQVSFIAHLMCCGWYAVGWLGKDDPDAWINEHCRLPHGHVLASTHQAVEMNEDVAAILGSGGDELARLRDSGFELVPCLDSLGYSASAPDDDEHSVEGISMGTRYLSALYWAITTMTTVGYGDVTAATPAEVLFVTISMLLGVTVFGYVVGSMASLVGRLNQIKERHNDKLEVLREYMRERKISPKLQQKVRLFYDHYLTNTSMFDEEDILAGLTDVLRREVLLHINREQFKSHSFLMAFDDTLASYLTGMTELRFYLPDDIVVRQGEDLEGMFLVTEGHMRIMQLRRPLNAGEEPFDAAEHVFNIARDQVFGTHAAIIEATSTVSALASSLVALFVLSRKTVGKIVQDFPLMGRQLQGGILSSLRNIPELEMFACLTLDDATTMCQYCAEYIAGGAPSDDKVKTALFLKNKLTLALATAERKGRRLRKFRSAGRKAKAVAHVSSASQSLSSIESRSLSLKSPFSTAGDEPAPAAGARERENSEGARP